MDIISRSEAKECGLTHYFTGKPCKRGHVEKRFVSTFQCAVCAKMHYDERRKRHPEKYAEARNKHYWANREKCIKSAMDSQKKNRERHLKNKRDYHRRNAERIRGEHRARYQENREELCAKQVEYRKNNREKLNAYYRKYRPDRMARDPDFRMRLKCSQMLRRVFLATGEGKKNKTELIIGYSGKDLRNHLERNMTSDMSWENYGELWEIDHVVPVMEMIRRGVKDPAKINALGNLMPEYKEFNMSKGDRFALSPRPML